MAMTGGFQKPLNATYQGDVVIQGATVGSNATAAKMIPGTAVERDTRDGSIKEYDGSGNVAGIIVYDGEYTDDEMPVDRTGYYPVGSNLKYATSADRIAVRLAASQTITMGGLLYPTTDGLFTAATAGTHDVRVVALESVTTTSEQAGTLIWCKMR